MKKQYIKDLKLNDNVDDFFAINQKDPLREYAGGTMFSLGLSDKTKKIQLKFWGGSNDIAVKELYDSLKKK